MMDRRVAKKNFSRLDYSALMSWDFRVCIVFVCTLLFDPAAILFLFEHRAKAMTVQPASVSLNMFPRNPRTKWNTAR